MTYDKENSEYHKSFEIKNNRKKLKIVVAIILILSIVGAIGSLAYSAGFIPLVGFLDVTEPPGYYVELNTEDFIEQYPEINDMPNLDKIKYKAYGSDESVDYIANYYKEKMEKEGYKLIQEGTAYLDGKNFLYYGFLKGLTAVGILLASGADQAISHNTMVIYTTGSALDYKEILDWYQNQA